MLSFTLFFCPFSPPLLCKSSPFAMQLHCFYTLIDTLLLAKSNAFTSEGLHLRKTKGLQGSIFNDEASNHSSFYLYICTIVLSIKRTTQEERTHHSSDKSFVFQQYKCPINTNQLTDERRKNPMEKQCNNRCFIGYSLVW